VAELGSQVKAAAARLAATAAPPDADAATLSPGSGHHDRAAEVTVIAPHQPPEGQGILAGSQNSPAEGQ
jgi:hypothetical protein